jgi:hypothetical protein
MQARIQQAQLQFSSITRSLDPAYPTNLAIMLLAPAAGLVNGAIKLVSGADIAAAALAGFWTGAAVFMAWVLAREIDIDYEYSAFVAVALAFAGTLLWSAPPLEIVALGTLILVARMINRVVGLPFKIFDSIAVMLAVVLLALLGNWLIVLAVAAAFLLDGLLVKPLRRHLVLAVVTAILAVLAYLNMPGTAGTLSVSYVAGTGIVAAAFAMTILATRSIKTPADLPEYKIHLSRAQALMIYMLVVAVITAVRGGDAAVPAYLPLWAVLAGVPLYRAYSTWIKR